MLKSPDKYYLFGLIVVFAISLLITNPTGNFPLNDDWSYGQASLNFVSGYGFKPHDFSSMPLLPQAIWGALFIELFGFSYEVLRSSTLVLAFIAMILVYCIVNKRVSNIYLSILSTFTLIFNPVFYSLACSFMTDVPAIFMIIVSLILVYHYLRVPSNTYLSYFILASTTSVLIRQTSLALPLAFFIAVYTTKVIQTKKYFEVKTIVTAGLPLLIALIALFILQFYLESNNRLPSFYHDRNALLINVISNPTESIAHIGYNVLANILYLGLFLFPVLIPIAMIKWKENRISFFKSILWIVLIEISCLLTAIAMSRNAIMPIIGNYITKSGIGPQLLTDAYILQIDNLRQLPTLFWLVTTAISLIGAAFLLYLVVDKIQVILQNIYRKTFKPDDLLDFILLLTSIIYFIPISVVFSFDRYLLPLILLLIILLQRAPVSYKIYYHRYRFITVSYIVLASFMLFAIFGTKDYFSWNRVRWSAIHNLIDIKRVPKDLIDGGFEFNGQYLYDTNYQPSQSKSWWWVKGDTYRIAFGPIPGYQIIETYEYSNWFPPEHRKIVVLKRN